MKKKVFLVAVAVCLVAIISAGTLAWFSDSDSVKSTFYVASSNEEADDIFSVGLQGKENATYVDLLPGQVVENLIEVENTGRYAQWVRVKITFSDAKAWKEVLGDTALTSMLDVSAGWTAGGTLSDETNDTVTYVYYLNSTLAKDEKAVAFQNVTIPTALTQKQAAAIGDFTVDVVAEAVQFDNLGKTSAKEAFEAVGWTEEKAQIG